MSAHAHHTPTLTIEDVTIPKGNVWRKLPLLFGVIGVAGLAGAWFSAGDDHRQFFYSYLTAFMFWLSIALGGLFFTLIHHGTRAGWSTVVRRLAENLMITLPLFVLLVIPIISHDGIHSLFHWAHTTPEVVNDPVLQAKSAFLNESAFTMRAYIMVGLWAMLALLLYRWSVKQDTSGDPKLSHRMRWIAPLGYVIFGMSMTLAALDWMMSLDPHWYSTIFGVYYFAGIVIAIMATLALLGLALQKSGMLRNAITTEHYHDLGKFAFAFVVFWAYIAFSQFMLIWYANIPEETIWYAHRMEGGWEYMTLILAVAHFLVPFFFLMSRHIKRRNLTLALGCIWLLVAHYIDLFWIIQPNLSLAVAHEAHSHHPHLTFHIADLLTMVGIGGLVLGVFSWRLGAKPIVAIKDPRISESLSFENF